MSIEITGDRKKATRECVEAMEKAVEGLKEAIAKKAYGTLKVEIILVEGTPVMTVIEGHLGGVDEEDQEEVKHGLMGMVLKRAAKEAEKAHEQEECPGCGRRHN